MGVTAIANAVATGSGLLGAGLSIASTAASWANMNYGIKFKMEVENYTDEFLEVQHNRCNTGLIVNPPAGINPGTKEAMSGHKTGNTALGVAGTVAWRIRKTNKMVVVMYSVPYSHDFHSNWCGVGVFNIDHEVDFFQLMYYESETSFKRKDFYYDADEVRYEGDDQWEVSATMSTHHQPEIQVKVYPKREEDLAKIFEGIEGTTK